MNYNNEAIVVVTLSSLCLIALVTCCPSFWPSLFQLQAPGGGISAMLCGTLLEGGFLVTSLVLGSVLLAQHGNRDDVGSLRTAMWISFSIYFHERICGGAGGGAPFVSVRISPAASQQPRQEADAATRAQGRWQKQ